MSVHDLLVATVLFDAVQITAFAITYAFSDRARYAVRPSALIGLLCTSLAVLFWMRLLVMVGYPIHEGVHAGAFALFGLAIASQNAIAWRAMYR